MHTTPFPPGALAVVATPIGNPADITLRALEVLRAADLIAAEDTRTARRLLACHGISRPLISYHDWNEAKRAEVLLDRVGRGERVALITEAGTPGLSDPGFDAVRMARQRGLPVFPVPGPSAVATFLSVSGLPTNAFSFLGFPPPRRAARRAFFARLADRPETLVFHESPRRVVDALQDALEVLGDRLCALGREMTKPHEEFFYGGIAPVLSTLRNRPKVLGEVCWGAAGVQPRTPPPAEDLQEAADRLLDASPPLRQAARELARRFGLPVKDAYALLLRRRAGPRS